MSSVLNLSVFFCHGNMIRMNGNVSFCMSEGNEPSSSIKKILFGDVRSNSNFWRILLKIGN